MPVLPEPVITVLSKAGGYFGLTRSKKATERAERVESPSKKKLFENNNVNTENNEKLAVNHTKFDEKNTPKLMAESKRIAAIDVLSALQMCCIPERVVAKSRRKPVSRA